MATPIGVSSKKPKGSSPRPVRAALTTRFGAVAISVISPLISAATESGIISVDRLMPVLATRPRTTGMNMATMPVELMNAPTAPTTTISSTMSRVSLPLADAGEPGAEAGGDAGGHQRLADDEQAADHQHGRVGKAGDGLVGRDDAGDGEGEQHRKRDGVGAKAVGGEGDDRRGQHGKRDPAVGAHLRLPAYVSLPCF